MTGTIDINDYMNRGVKRLAQNIAKAAFSNPRAAMFMFGMQKTVAAAQKRREKHEREGTHIPVFLISSITEKCNLFCHGCYARSNGLCGSDSGEAAGQVLSALEWARIFAEVIDAGISFNILAGGEPLLRKEVIEAAGEQKKMIFGIFTNEHKFSGNLCRELIKIDAFIETSISQKRPIPVSVLREETVAKYPYWATRELLMNAIMHRDYQTNAPVQFYEYDDRIEVQNPGGLYGKVSEDNFPNVSDYRNPFIAEAMKILGYVNRFSRGVYRVQKELVENGNGEAAFDFSLITAFKVVENVSKRYFEAGFGADESGDAQEPPKNRPRNTQETPKKLTEEIVSAITDNPTITRMELAALLGHTPDKIKHHLKKLTEQGIIEHVGSTKAGEWVILKK